MLGDDELGAALVEFGCERVAVENFVCDRAAKGDMLDERRNPDAVVAMTRQQNKAHQIAERVRERDNLGAQVPLGAANGLARECPDFCVWALFHAGFRHGHAVKRVSNIMASWLPASTS